MNKRNGCFIQSVLDPSLYLAVLNGKAVENAPIVVSNIKQLWVINEGSISPSSNLKLVITAEKKDSGSFLILKPLGAPNTFHQTFTYHDNCVINSNSDHALCLDICEQRAESDTRVILFTEKHWVKFISKRNQKWTIIPDDTIVQLPSSIIHRATSSQNQELLSSAISVDQIDQETASKMLSMEELLKLYPAHVKIISDKMDANCAEQQKVEQLNQCIHVPYMYSKFMSSIAEVQVNQDQVLKIKMGITDIDFWRQTPQLFKSMLAPIAPPFGFVHAFLIIGPWSIHWFDNSLVKFDIGMGDGVLAVDCQPGINIDDKETILKVMEKCRDWNLTKTYGMTSNHCQAFVKELLQVIQCDLPDSMGISFREYFKRIESHQGANQLKLERIFHSPFDGKIIKFESHKQLDNYLRKMLLLNKSNLCERAKVLEKANMSIEELINVFKLAYPFEYSILKAYDRAWWLKKVKNERLNKPVGSKCIADNCCFGDPTQNGSIPLKVELKY